MNGHDHVCAMRVAEFSDSYLRELNEVLPHATPIGAYCIGIVTAILARSSRMPDRALIERAARCTRTDEAIDLAEEALHAGAPRSA